MSWLQKLLPPKIQRTGNAARKTVPEGLWTKCAACDAVLYSTDLEKNLNVCPKCGHHERLAARPRLDGLLDPDGRFEIGAEVLPAFDSFAAGVRQWREELLAYFDEPTTNGYAEGVINKVKVIKRRAYGLPSFEGFRERVLLACG